MQQFFEIISDYIHEHWLKAVTAAAFMIAGWFWGKRRERAQWSKKEFLHRINISLNVINDGKLFIRTIVEKSCLDVFLNSVAVEKITEASRVTREDSPILELPGEEYWYYLNAVLNEVAEKFAFGQIKRDMGQPVVKEHYLICLTCEKAGDIRTHKIRAMLVKKKTLQNLPEKQPQLESPNHLTRWKTLNLLATEYKKNSDRFLEMELCI